MPTKELPLHPYEEVRYKQYMRNSSRLQQLGLPGFTGVFARTTIISQEKNKTNARDREDSKSEYDPLQDDNGEEDLIADDIAKGSKKKTCKKANQQTSDLISGGVKFWSRKRVYARQAPTKDFSQHDDNTNMADKADGITLPAGQNHMTNEVRIHVPVLTHWKEYKKQPAQFNLFMGRLCAKFNIDTSDEIVKKGCLEMMNPYLLHKYKRRIYILFLLILATMKCCQQVKNLAPYKCCFQGDKYKDQEPDAFDLFKECHYSKKNKVYTPIIQLAITQMEKKLSAPTEGEQPNFATQVVADPRCSVKNVKADLEAEKRANVELQSIVNSQRAQVDDLSKKVQKTENARIRDQEEIKMKQAEMEAKLEVLLGQS
uniref:Uncharacterized protein n=1 Tax=Setaria viridis TaxID=4556 RepID=A0A4U6UCY0_SETVI|nr:hypothetical protein SEVIR_5G030100v2 [Setaria viridis]